MSQRTCQFSKDSIKTGGGIGSGHSWVCTFFKRFHDKWRNMHGFLELIQVKEYAWILFANKRPVGLIAPPFIISFLATENWSGHYFTQCIWKVDQNRNKVKFESVRTLLKITHLASRKSYLVIICPNSYEKLTKIEFRSSWTLFEHCSKSLISPIGSHLVIICSNSYEQLTKSKIKSSLFGFEHCSKSLIHRLGSHI